MTSASRSALVLLAAVVILTPANIFSCGPFWEGPTFVRKDQPDKPTQDFVDGKLGVLWSDFDHRYLVVAYRYLSNKPLPAAERRSWERSSTPNITEMPKDWNPSTGPFEQPIYAWLKARSGALGLSQLQQIDIQRYRTTEYFNAYPNCGDDAFITAAATAQKRGETFGVGDPRTRDWVAGQDAVFQNCGDSRFEYTGYEEKRAAPPLRIPATATVDDPLLKYDRDYQTAAAYFYAGLFDTAILRYQAIARDEASPWHQVASYLIARCYIRKATLGVTGESSFTPEPMQAAEAQLQSILNNPALAPWHTAARRLLNYVEARLHPNLRLHEIALELSGSASGEDFRRNLMDYDWLLSRQVGHPESGAEEGSAKEAGVPQSTHKTKTEAQPEGARPGASYDDLTDWIVTFRVADTKSVEHSFERWQATKSLPWLVSALVGTHTTDPHAIEIQNAAKAISDKSPAYTTLLYHRARLLLEQKDQVGARRLLDTNMPRIMGSSPSDRNSFFAQRMSVASNYDDFLRFAPRTPINLLDVIGKFSYSCDDGTCYSTNQGPNIKVPQRLDTDSVRIFNQALPLSKLVEAAEGTVLPTELRDKLALTSWLRAGLLDDTATTRQLERHVLNVHPELIAYVQAYDAADSSAARRFALAFMAMHFPEIQPFINAGPIGSIAMPGISSGSWWCADMGVAANLDNSVMPPNVKQAWRNPDEANASSEPSYPAFLSIADRARAKQEWGSLVSTKAAPYFFAEAVLPWAEAHPEDPSVPEALHLFVRSTRYGCADNSIGPYSKQAFTLLHKRYPDSEWTKKTKYWFN